MKTIAEITPTWTLGRLKEEYPGIELLLYAHFGIGSRERSGFSATETLDELLRRHLVFDTAGACDKLTALAREDMRYSIEAPELKRRFDEFVVIDARDRSEYDRCHLTGSVYLTAESVKVLKKDPTRPVVTLCRDGTQSPSAARVLRGQGLEASHLVGGLEQWSYQVDSSVPILYPLEERGDHWYLLADDRTLRYRRKEPLLERGWCVLDRETLKQTDRGARLLDEIKDLELVVSTPHTFAVRSATEFEDLSGVVGILDEPTRDDQEWDRQDCVSDIDEERRAIDRVLTQEAPKLLAHHKGTVEIADYSDRVVTLTLGGGCVGCASVNITTQRSLAACLYRSVPVLDGIRSIE